MDVASTKLSSASLPKPKALFELLKPVTWFPPMWAFMCGVVSTGLPLADIWQYALLGAVLAGPLACGASQIMNDWCDRAVDAINEPQRPIPSGRVPGKWGFYFAIFWSLLTALYSAFLGPWVFGATLLGLVCGWLYSSPPFRLKRSGWWGPGLVGLSYEGLAWFTGAAVVIGSLPDIRIILLALLFSIGTHGIMTLNDFKAVEGDRRMGIKSLPVELGVGNAAFLSCVIMAAPQVIVMAMMINWSVTWAALTIAILLSIQFVFMVRWVREPERLAPWFNLTGVLSFVTGMLVSAFAVGSVISGEIS